MFQVKRYARLAAALVVPFFLMACAAAGPEPVVASFNEASVGIQLDANQMGFATEEARRDAVAKADAKAAEICSRGPNRKAEYASSRTFSTGQYTSATERLYLCLK
ncbi:hypothetical protein SAMN05421666_1663 [Roseovarius nanhaiticus]|uniref:Lipoprotein n=1 Tax=Roseovarius nanhaiticus TaxID=573024 RepID=A0A1N7G4D2_9RHOB|nr:hypothetical protein [Roseovarius nanhaiticus]SEK37569.1 hypothetical protein SAMN05216208_0473 [Roseovarius nanhaiticus]SIS07415.1 hypothetical protein SAMN05421666_1663 [Roseovarius nanhaiticus]